MNEKLIPLLLGVLHQDPGRLDRGALAALSEQKWEDLIALAAEQRVCALFYHKLRALGCEDLIHEEPRQTLKRLYLASAARILRYLAAFQRIVGAFNATGIPVIPLKGIYLVHTVYEQPGLREMNDLDLMVPKPRLAEAVEILRRLGYEGMTPFSIEVDTAIAHHLTRLIKEGGCAVELHWTLTKPGIYYSIDVAELWERVVPAQIGGMEVLGLSPEDLLLHLCLHTSYQHQFAFGLRPFCDIAQVIELYKGSLDWVTLQERARRWNWQRGVYLALLVAQHLLGAAVPAETLAALRPADFSEEVYRAAANQIFTKKYTADPSRELSRLWMQKNWWARFKVLLGRIFISKKTMAKAYALPPDSPLIYLYYPIRMKDMILRNGGEFIRLWRGDKDALQHAKRTYVLQAWLEASG